MGPFSSLSFLSSSFLLSLIHEAWSLKLEGLNPSTFPIFLVARFVSTQYRVQLSPQKRRTTHRHHTMATETKLIHPFCLPFSVSHQIIFINMPRPHRSPCASWAPVTSRTASPPLFPAAARRSSSYIYIRKMYIHPKNTLASNLIDGEKSLVNTSSMRRGWRIIKFVARIRPLTLKNWKDRYVSNCLSAHEVQVPY